MIRPISPADRAAFLAKWADRLILTRQPVCPECGRMIAPERWDAHKQLCCSGPAQPADRVSCTTTAPPAPFVRRCEECGKPCTYPLGVAGYCLRCAIERQYHTPGPDGRPTTKGTP